MAAGQDEQGVRTPPSLRSYPPRPPSALTSSTLGMLPSLPLAHAAAAAPTGYPLSRPDLPAAPLPPHPPYLTHPPGASISVFASEPPVHALPHLPATAPDTLPPVSAAGLPPAPPDRTTGKRQRPVDPAQDSRVTPVRRIVPNASASSTHGPATSESSVDDIKPPHPNGRPLRTAACTNCRRRKLKCDKNTPCAACVSRGEARECALGAGLLLPEPTPSAAESLQTRLERLETLLTMITDKVMSQEGVVQPRPASAESGRTPNSAPFASTVPPPRTSPSGDAGLNFKRPAKKLAPKAQALITLIRPDTSATASNEVRSMILREALDLYPEAELVRTCCTIYFKEADAMLPVVNETKFWRQFSKHEAFIRRSRDGEVVWSESLRGETTFLALVLAVMVVGLIYSLDAQLFRHFKERYDFPLSKFLNMTFRLQCTLDNHERPTLDTVRISLVAYQVLFQLRAAWTPNIFTAVLTQDALCLGLATDPPPNCPKDLFFDRMNLWTCSVLLECFSAVKIGRAPIINCDSQMATPSFLYSQASWDEASMDGHWSYLSKYRFELSRVALASMRRDAMAEEESFAFTLKLQTRLDNLLEAMPSRLKEALEDPLAEGRRLVSVSIISRSMHAWLEMFLHGRHYARGWTDVRYSTSRRVFYQAALFFVSTFIDYWKDLLRRLNVDQHEPDESVLADSAPGLMFRICPLARTAFKLLSPLERHSQLTAAYPRIVTDEERSEYPRMLRLTAEMHELRHRFPSFFAFDESDSDHPGSCPDLDTSGMDNSLPAMPLPMMGPVVVPDVGIASAQNQAQDQAGVHVGQQDSSALDHAMALPMTSNSAVTAPSELMPVPAETMPPPLEMLLQMPEVQPMFGNDGPYDGGNGMPMTFEELLLTSTH